MYPCANLVSCNCTSDKKTKYNKIKRVVQYLFLNKFRISISNITQENCLSSDGLVFILCDDL
jgi:hypothetical protein